MEITRIVEILGPSIFYHDDAGVAAQKKTKHVGEREKKRELTPLPLLTVGWLEKAPNFIAIVNVYIDAMGGGERKNHHHVHFTFIHLEKIFTFLTHFSDALFHPL